MRTIIGLMAGLTLFAGCAAPPPSVKELLVGTWTCSIDQGPQHLVDVHTYGADGKMKAENKVTQAALGMTAETSITYSGEWTLKNGDKDLDETTTEAKIGYIKVNGQDSPVQPQDEADVKTVIGKTRSSHIKSLDKAKLVLEDSVRETTCTR
ncbi:MAG TPA: hypothetical protein VG942_01125 [Hyphomonadaceae bacterium]|nr:hypothetical protein [Hyphomonadaceae bacterium]